MSALFNDFDSTTDGNVVGHPIRDALEQIERRDPSGWESQPTDADYAAHRAWAVATFGQGAWDTYTNASWGAWGTNPV